LKTLLSLQELDLRIEACVAREREIPKQKDKFNIYRERLAHELAERERVCKSLTLEQRECESEIEQKQAQIKKYDNQLLGVKKNDEYQALLHEMDLQKKQIGLKEERIIQLMMEIDDAKARLEEDRKRIEAELKDIDRQCAEIDTELTEAVRTRVEFESRRTPLVEQVNNDLMARYLRIRKSIKSGPAVVPLRGSTCMGCHMAVTPQIANEILAGEKIHTCAHCGRLLYEPVNYQDEAANVR
jgi:predicted  nucleic acid-binding Zn-ribbon protein